MNDTDPLELLSRTILANRSELAAVARREGLTPEDAIDTVSESLSHYFQAVLRDEAPSAPADARRYVIALVRNRARNERRRAHRRRPHVELDDVPPIEGASAEELVAEAEEHVRLRACVAKLCDTQRSVVTLRLLEEHAGEDVAERLGISRGYVDVLLHRAKGALRTCLLETDAA